MLKSGRVRAGLVYRSDRRRCALAQYAGCSIGYFASELSGGRVVDGGRSFPPPLTIITTFKLGHVFYYHSFVPLYYRQTSITAKISHTIFTNDFSSSRQSRVPVLKSWNHGLFLKLESRNVVVGDGR